jgi:hypothetical protein
MRVAPGIACGIFLSFLAGLLAHALYQRWNPTNLDSQESLVSNHDSFTADNSDPPSFRVTFLPVVPAAEETSPDLPALMARDVEKIRAVTGRQARIRGRVFRVGHSANSNTYFLNFGPSRQALTAVIFASAVEVFEKSKLSPKKFENREVEITGSIKDHPQYGLEVILEDPKQIIILD